jgi:exodeoxyribonuclease V alpha subunit
MSKIKYFTGRVLNVIFEDTSTFFYILRVRLDDDPDSKSYDPLGSTVITVKGNIPGLNVEPGTWFGFEGAWVNHKTHGKQVDITRAPMIRGAWDTKTIVKVLSAHNVGRLTLTLMAERFGDGLAKALDDPEKLMQIKGVDKVTAEHIGSRWKTVRALFQTLSFLSQFPIPKTAINQIWALFGDDAEEVLSTNPWDLVRIQGIEFKVVDEIALRLGLDIDNPNRVRGAVLYLTKAQRGMGHLFLRSGDLLALTKGLIQGLTHKQFGVALKTLRDEKLIIIDRDTRPGVTAIYEPWLHQMEQESARLLLERKETAKISDGKALTDYIKMLGNVGPKTQQAVEGGSTLIETAQQALSEWTEATKVSLSKQQLQGALNALIHPVSIITGLPGTGKSFSLRTVVKVLQDAEVPILLIAPTGIAAKRLVSATGAEASTIHRAFQAQGMDTSDSREATYAGIVGGSKKDVTATDGSQEEWGYNEEAPHPAEFVIVDESSMVDQHLLYRILSCTSKTCRVVFVGDAAQLPSVGPGNVLRDMIASGKFPVASLTEIFRQEETSDIILAAHAINSGKMPEPSPGKNDYNFLHIASENEIADKLIKSVVRLYQAGKNFQVLSPRHAGTLGVTNLNSRIRDLLNPKMAGLQEMKIGSGTIREGDRVMVVRNNYTYNIFNGDVGKVVNLDRSKKEVEVKIWGASSFAVKLPFREAASHLRLAYVITCHKSQGQGFDYILLPWVNGYRHQLQRNLVYTAITRARKKVFLFGHPEAMQRAVKNNEVVSRNTLFPERLQAPAPPVKIQSRSEENDEE